MFIIVSKVVSFKQTLIQLQRLKLEYRTGASIVLVAVKNRYIIFQYYNESVCFLFLSLKNVL